MKTNIAITLDKIKKNAHGRATAFVIGNTSDLFTKGRYYETPMRETSELIYGGVIVRDVATARAIARLVDGKVDYVFVDDEKKIRRIYYGSNDVGNIEKTLRAVVKKSELITYKGNDLAVDAVDTLFQNVSKDVGAMKVAVIGMGNLGSKIALKLVERGAHISAFRRDKKKLKLIIAGLNAVKSEYTLASITGSKDITSACRDALVVIGVTNEKSVITRDMLGDVAPGAILVDAGKGCFSDEIINDHNFTVYRVDVSFMQKYIFSGLIGAHCHFSKSLGRRHIPELNVNIISLGLVGRCGEFVVDDISNPSVIIGVVATRGILENKTPRVEKSIEELKKVFKIKL